MDDLDTWLERVYAADGDADTLNRLYDEWARDYDQQLWASGNPYLAILAGFSGRHIADFNASILDAGCGTGNMALLLAQMGYRNIDGLDPSPGMLELARTKRVYRSLHEGYLGATVDLPANHYDAVVAAGVLTHGHAPAESLDGILSITRPGGVILFSLSQPAYLEHGFKERIDALEAAGAWHSIDQSELFRTYPFSDQAASLRHWVLCYRKAVDDS